MLLLKDKQVKVRKKHRCCWCNESIDVGDYAQYRVYIFEGEFTYDYMHPECYKAMKSVPYNLYSWIPGDFNRGSYDDDYPVEKFDSPEELFKDLGI